MKMMEFNLRITKIESRKHNSWLTNLYALVYLGIIIDLAHFQDIHIKKLMHGNKYKIHQTYFSQRLYYAKNKVFLPRYYRCGRYYL